MKNFQVCAAVFLFSAAAYAQQAATVTFSLDFPGSNPSHYHITVANDGRATYSSNGQLNENAEPADLAELPFTISNSVRDQIFQIAKRTHYFSGKIDSGLKNIANTGNKTLAYKDTEHNTQTAFNYSTNPAIQEITAIFQGLSLTLEFGRRLTFFRKYQKTALDEDLKKMEQMQRDKNLGDLNAIADVLTAIANDTSIMNISRARALRLLAMAGK